MNGMHVAVLAEITKLAALLSQQISTPIRSHIPICCRELCVCPLVAAAQLPWVEHHTLAGCIVDVTVLPIWPARGIPTLVAEAATPCHGPWKWTAP